MHMYIHNDCTLDSLSMTNTMYIITGSVEGLQLLWIVSLLVHIKI